MRWGSPSVSAIAGGQAVLGPALLVGSFAAAISAVLAGGSVVLLAGDRLTAPAFGLVAAAFVAGPAFPHDLGVRILGIVVCVLAAMGAARLPRVVEKVAVSAAVIALLLAAIS